MDRLYFRVMRWQVIAAIPAGLAGGLWLIFARRWMLGAGITAAGLLIAMAAVRAAIGRFFPVKVNGKVDRQR
jgi:hypothetical protein